MLCLVASGHSLAARPIGEVFERSPSPSRSSRPAWRTRALAAAALVVVAGAAWRVGAQVDRAPRPQPPRETSAPRAQSLAPPASAGPLTPAQPAVVSAPIERRWHPSVGEVRSPAAGELSWKEPRSGRVARGEVLGEVRAKAAPEAPAAEAGARLEQLERLAAEDPVYAEFLERERAAVNQQKEHTARVGFAAPAAGQTSPTVAAGARVGLGDLVAQIVDPEAWRLSVVFGGQPPAVGTACEVSGDGPATTAECRVVEVLPMAEGARVTVALRASAAPWLERAQSPTVRFPGPRP
jgi:hypothetical protein